MRARPPSQLRLIFITGTDTGVGKTLLTALLLSHLRRCGCPARALKPVCSGSRADAQLLHRLQDGEIALGQVNPFHFPEPVAPLVAARKQRRSINLGQVLGHIREQKKGLLRRHQGSTGQPTLLVEGAGGLLAPLGEDFCALDLIGRLRCESIVVSRNQLGTINHTLLTVGALRAAVRRPKLKVVLMPGRKPHPSAASNPEVLAKMLAPAALFTFPSLGAGHRHAGAIDAQARRHKKLLGRILGGP